MIFEAAFKGPCSAADFSRVAGERCGSFELECNGTTWRPTDMARPARRARPPADAQVREREEFRCGALDTFVSALPATVPLRPSLHYSRVRDERAAAACSQPAWEGNQSQGNAIAVLNSARRGPHEERDQESRPPVLALHSCGVRFSGRSLIVFQCMQYSAFLHNMELLKVATRGSAIYI